MLKKATLTLAVALAFSQNGFAAAQPDYTVKRESVTSTNLSEVKRALTYKRDIIINDTAYMFSSKTADQFGQTYTYTASDSADKLVIRERSNSLSAILFEDGVQKSLSLTNTGGTLSRYHVKVTGNEPGVPGVQQTSAAPYWHTLRPSSYDTKRTVSETISELPEDAGAAFFISAEN